MDEEVQELLALGVLAEPDWELWEQSLASGLPSVVPDWEPGVMREPAGCDCGGCACSPVAPSPELAALPEPEPVRWSVPGVWGDVPVRPVLPDSPSAPVLALQQAAEAVCETGVGVLTEGQSLVDSRALLGVWQRLRVEGLRRLAEVTDRELYVLAGARSTGAWLAGAVPDADRTDVVLAGQLRLFRVLQQAVRDGLVPVLSAKKVVRALRKCAPYVDLPDGLIDTQPGELVISAVVGNVLDLVGRYHCGFGENDLLLHELTDQLTRITTSGGCQLDRLERAFTLMAQHVPPNALAGLLEEQVLAVLPSELEKAHRSGEQQAGLSLRRNDDHTGWQVRGQLSAQCGERLFTALRAEARRDPHNPLDTDAAEALRVQGVNPFTDQPLSAGQGQELGWPRPRPRRLHDALDRLLGRYLEHGLGGTHHKVPVQINVTLPAATIDRQPGALPARGDSGAVLSRSMIRRWWSDSRVTAYLASRGGKVLRVVHTGRTLTATERRAALIEQGNQCAGTGCCRGSTGSTTDPTTDLRPHHVRRFTDDGRTSLEGTVMICDTLHYDLHEGGKTLRLRNGRYLNEHGWVDPTSINITPPPF